MKTKMFLATATAALLMAISTVSASEPLLSPKAKALADSLARGPGTTTDMIDRSLKNGSPKHVACGVTLKCCHSPRKKRCSFRNLREVDSRSKVH